MRNYWKTDGSAIPSLTRNRQETLFLIIDHILTKNIKWYFLESSNPKVEEIDRLNQKNLVDIFGDYTTDENKRKTRNLPTHIRDIIRAPTRCHNKHQNTYHAIYKLISDFFEVVDVDETIQRNIDKKPHLDSVLYHFKKLKNDYTDHNIPPLSLSDAKFIYAAFKCEYASQKNLIDKLCTTDGSIYHTIRQGGTPGHLIYSTTKFSELKNGDFSLLGFRNKMGMYDQASEIHNTTGIGFATGKDKIYLAGPSYEKGHSAVKFMTLKGHHDTNTSLDTMRGFIVTQHDERVVASRIFMFRAKSQDLKETAVFAQSNPHRYMASSGGFSESKFMRLLSDCYSRLPVNRKIESMDTEDWEAKIQEEFKMAIVDLANTQEPGTAGSIFGLFNNPAIQV